MRLLIALAALAAMGAAPSPAGVTVTVRGANARRSPTRW